MNDILANVLLIAGMALVTFAVRYGTLAALRTRELPPAVRRALAYVPIAVLSAITASYVLYRGGRLAASIDNPYLVAAVVAIGVSAATRRLGLTVVVGSLAFVALRLLGLAA